MAETDQNTLQLLSGYLPSGWLKLRSVHDDPNATAHELEFSIQYGPKRQPRTKYCHVMVRSVEELQRRVNLTPLQLAFILLDDIFWFVDSGTYTLANVVAVTNNVLSYDAVAFLYREWEPRQRGSWQVARRMMKLVARRAWEQHP